MNIREELNRVLDTLPEVSLEAVLEYASLTEEQELFMNGRDELNKVLDALSEESLENALWYASQTWFVEFAEKERELMEKYSIKKPSPELKQKLKEWLWLNFVLSEAKKAQGKV